MQLRFRIPGPGEPMRSISPWPAWRCGPPWAHTSTPFHNHLPGRAPDRLEEAVLLCEPVHAVVGLAHGADEAAEGVDLVLAGVAAVLIDLGDADLDGGVVLGLDDASGSGLEGVSIARRVKFERCGHSRICGGRKLQFVSHCSSSFKLQAGSRFAI
jgi:hypothetical protein